MGKGVYAQGQGRGRACAQHIIGHPGPVAEGLVSRPKTVPETGPALADSTNYDRKRRRGVSEPSL